ncbi:cyclin-B1-2 [Lathyrus oleraceus]|uniref:cyclin-B1-2 n=1 Tax=Pisum sativum TaxID=3888 RepID=UPI0021D39AEF|nr:cyclin-B1-2-like [Pisum sativum]
MEEASKTIAHQIGGIQNDVLRFGLPGVKSDIVGSHPLESSLQSVRGVEEAMKRQCKVNLYGAAFPLKEELDRQILSRFQRPPGVIPSSMLGLETVTGSLDHFGFEDFLNGDMTCLSFFFWMYYLGFELISEFASVPNWGGLPRLILALLVDGM